MEYSWFRTSLVILGVCLMPIAAQAQRVNVDYDKAVDFSKYKTYAWETGQPAPNPLVHKRILNAIDNQLAAKGRSKVESSANAIVVYYAAIEEERQLNAWGGGPRWSGTVNVETILTGQLVVDIYDGVTKELLWRGFVSDTASEKADKNEKKLNEAVAKLFKRFPPAGGNGTDKH